MPLLDVCALPELLFVVKTPDVLFPILDPPTTGLVVFDEPTAGMEPTPVVFWFPGATAGILCGRGVVD